MLRAVGRLFLLWLLVPAAGCSGPDLRRPTGDRVLLVGVDAATWDVMRPLMDAGELPAFSRLVREGWSGVLMSMEPTISPALWTTIATGKRPEEHGITGFLSDAHGGSGDGVPVTSNQRRSEALWTIASRHGRRVNVVGWYVTWPVEEVNGVMVSDRFTPVDLGALVGDPGSITAEHPGVHPASLDAELRGRFVTAEIFVNPMERNRHRMVKAYPVDASRTAMAEHLMQARPADLTMVYLWGIDPMQHYFWKYYQPQTWPGPPLNPDEVEFNARAIPDYYRDTDELLGRLLAHAGPRDTVVVVSDHGAGPVTTYDPAKPVSGDHRLEGIIVMAGRQVRPGRAATPPSLLDVAPTVLYLLGLPAGKDMAGEVIREAIAPEVLARRPPRRIETYEQGARPAAPPVASPMDEQIKERLRSLGYIQ